MRDVWIDGHRDIANLIKAAQQRGEIAPGRDPHREAVHALTLADGFVSHILMGHFSPETTLRTIDDYLDHLFAP